MKQVMIMEEVEVERMIKSDTSANKCFITGGSGFVGRNLIPQLVREGFEVYALARSKQAAAVVESLGAVPVTGEVYDVQVLKSGMADCSVVFHLAAIVNTWGNFEQIYQTNVDGTKAVIEAAQACKVKRLVLLSTVCVVLDGTPKYDIDEEYKIETELTGIYSRTKAISEQIVLEANSKCLEAIVVRSSLVWGNGDTSVLGELLKLIKQNRFIWFSKGSYQISTTHVSNLCSALILACRNGKAGEIYYATDGKSVLFRDFIGKLLESQGVNTEKIKSIPRWAALIIAKCMESFYKTFIPTGTPMIDSELIYTMGTAFTIDDRKIRKKLGYRNVVSIKEGLGQLQLEHMRQ